MSRFTVIYDACVLYPAPLRDILIRLAAIDLFKAHWTDQIHAEWITALLRQGKFSQEKLEYVRNLMDVHVKDAKITGYQSLITGLKLPDPDDRHVLAAAIHCNANAIITLNHKDFPKLALEPYGIEILHPDDFIYYQIDMVPEICCSVVREQRLALKNPELNVDEFLRILEKQQLPQTVSILKQFIQFL